MGERLVAMALPGWTLARASINSKGITKLLPSLVRYSQVAEHVHPVLCIADADRACVARLVSDWLPRGAGPRLLLRIAVPEAESWLLADRRGVADFFGVSLKSVPPHPEHLTDAKLEVLKLAKRSCHRLLREEMISSTHADRQGSGYNTHLCSFVRGAWQAERGADSSPSLARAVSRVEQLSTLP